MKKLFIFFVKQINDIRQRGVTELVKKINNFIPNSLFSSLFPCIFILHNNFDNKAFSFGKS